MEYDAKEPFYIGRWLIQPRQNRIRGPEKTTRVEPKVMDVLLCLARQPGEVVTRDQLFETVWAGTIVTDDVLTRSISTLRKVFDDDPRNPGVIETIPKTGYRLIAPKTLGHRGDSVPPAVPTLELAPSMPKSAAAPTARRSAPRWMIWMTGGALGLLLLSGVFWALRLATPLPPIVFHPTPLTSYPGPEDRPALSPDGKQVAFAWRGPEGDNADVYVKLIGSEAPLRLTEDPAYEHAPAWAPDGSQVAFMRRSEEGCWIYLIAALGGPARKLASCGASIYGDLAWSPDGRWLALNDKAAPEDAFGIVLIAPETLEKRALTTPPPDTWGDHDPAFSPDGTRLSFTRSVSEGMQDVYTVSVNGGEPTRLTTDSRNIYGHAWTTDGKNLLFASNRTGRMGLWRIRAGGRTPVWVGLGDGQASFPNIAGQRMVYQQSSGAVNIWQAEAGRDSSAASLIASTRWDLHPQFSPEGRKIAFTSNRSGSYEVWLADADGTNAAKLTDFGGPFTSTPRWSPDGRRLVFTARPGGQADVYIIDAEGALPRRLTTAPTDEMAASWSRDGQSIYFSSNRTGMWQVWKMPAEGGEAVQITQNGGFGPMEAPDGQSLYYAKHNANGLWRKPTTGSAETLVLDHLDSRDWGSWAVHDAGLYYIKRGRPTILAFHTFATGQTDTLFIPQKGIPRMDPAFAVSPDGHRLLFGQPDRSESDLMVVEDFR